LSLVAEQRREVTYHAYYHLVREPIAVGESVLALLQQQLLCLSHSVVDRAQLIGPALS
jgi:hypothetical protein